MNSVRATYSQQARSTLSSGGIARHLQGQIGPISLDADGCESGGDAVILSGSVGSASLGLRIQNLTGEDHLRHSIAGDGAGGRVELISHIYPDKTVVSGTVAGEAVLLQETRWDKFESTITGSVGDQRVRISQRNQLDGAVLTGYVGSQRFNLREREIPGRGLDLSTVEYLAALTP